MFVIGVVIVFEQKRWIIDLLFYAYKLTESNKGHREPF